jgi:hypothetical protein
MWNHATIDQLGDYHIILRSLAFWQVLFIFYDRLLFTMALITNIKQRLNIQTYPYKIIHSQAYVLWLTLLPNIPCKSTGMGLALWKILMKPWLNYTKEEDDKPTFVVVFFYFCFCAPKEDDDELTKLIVFFSSFDGL